MDSVQLAEQQLADAKLQAEKAALENRRWQAETYLLGKAFRQAHAVGSRRNQLFSEWFHVTKVTVVRNRLQIKVRRACALVTSGRRELFKPYHVSCQETFDDSGMSTVLERCPPRGCPENHLKGWESNFKAYYHEVTLAEFETVWSYVKSISWVALDKLAVQPLVNGPMEAECEPDHEIDLPHITLNSRELWLLDKLPFTVAFRAKDGEENRGVYLVSPASRRAARQRLLGEQADQERSLRILSSVGCGLDSEYARGHRVMDECTALLQRLDRCVT